MARENVNVSVMCSSRSNHKTMGMEGSDGDWRRPITKETRVGLEMRYRLAVVDVEDLDPMPLCATGIVSMLNCHRGG